ncbi:hypothetical protein SAMN05661096_02824 [Marivirga sericea]|uniref:Uncharacterized protein n=1 Tax=Marivirga sericea TaxID=1028 RepID=A0A1X7KK76_9BACT|nr:hypothetical protein SAMN05661096_02824 [Marivirga sericea]
MDKINLINRNVIKYLIIFELCLLSRIMLIINDIKLLSVK